MRWVIIGGSGFIGRSLCSHLVSGGEEVVSVSRAREHPVAGVQQLQRDLLAPEPFDGLFQAGDRVIFLAGLASQIACARNPQLSSRLNRELPVSCLGRADEAGVESFLFLSSVKAEQPLAGGALTTEYAGGTPRAQYGRDKAAAEVALISTGSRCRVNVLRPANVYVDKLSPLHEAAARGALSAAMSIVRLAGKLPQAGRRSYVGLSDLCDAIERVINKSSIDRQVFNVAEPNYPALGEAVARYAGRQVGESRLLSGLLALVTWSQGIMGKIGLKSPAVFNLARDMVQSEVYSAAKLRRLAGWQPLSRMAVV